MSRRMLGGLAAAAIVLALVAASSRDGGANARPATLPALEPIAALPLITPEVDVPAERTLAREGHLRGIGALQQFLLISSLPVRPRLAELHAPLPPVRRARLHISATRIALTAREAPVVPSDEPLKPWPEPVVPGALPPGFRYSYDDDYHGWPVAPLHGWHVLHGGFDDPRAGGYHFGVDIAVDDSRPALEAPQGLSHRVYAVESGTMHWAKNTQKKPCNARRLDVGHFSYWHVSTSVKYGSHIIAGQMIGWTCLNEWHVHLSEWARVDGVKRWVNPLHPGGKLSPYVDRAPPVIRAVYAYGPPPTTWKPGDTIDVTNPDEAPQLGLRNLHGAVDLRAWIDDGQGFLGVLRDNAKLASTMAPYRIWVQIRQEPSNAVVWQRATFQNDLLMSGVLPFYAVYAAGSRSSLSDYDCLHSRIACDGRLFYHLLNSGGRYLWDTRSVANGDYRLTIKAYDIVGSVTRRVASMRVRNP